MPRPIPHCWCVFTRSSCYKKKNAHLYHPTNTHWAIAIWHASIFCLKFHVHCDLLMASQSGVGGCLLRPCWVLLFLCWLVAFIPATKSSQIKTGSKRKKCHTGMVIVAAMAPAHAPSAKCSGVLQNKIMLTVYLHWNNTTLNSLTWEKSPNNLFWSRKGKRGTALHFQ
jgi:hypothetical protein